MKISFYEVRHFSPNFHKFTGLKTIFAKKKVFSPKIGEKKETFCLVNHQFIFRGQSESNSHIIETFCLVNHQFIFRGQSVYLFTYYRNILLSKSPICF